MTTFDLRRKFVRWRDIRSGRGFSLTELMIAMALSLVLLAGTVVVFTSSKGAYANIDHLSRVQENGRYALDQIIRDLRTAGYTGCSKVPRTNTTLNNATGLAWRFDTPIMGYQATSGTTWSPALDPYLTSYSPTGFNDVLVVRIPKPGATPTLVSSLMGTGTSNVTITAATASSVAVNDILMISDCENRVFFEATGYSVAGGIGTISHAASGATTYSPGNASNDLTRSFGTRARVMPLVTNAYFLAPATSGGTNVSLWRKSSAGAAEELIEGVDSFQVLYGIDTNGDNNQAADSYVTAQAVTDWNTVVSVRVALLVRSLEEYGVNTDTTPYNILGVSVGPFGDRRVRQLFTTTVTLRNKTI